MKFLLTLFVILIATVLVANLAIDQPGYVLLSYGKTSVELPLVDFIIALLLLIFASYLLIWFLLSLRRTPSGIRKLRQNQQLSKARRQLMQGLIQLAEGNWEKAEQQLANSARRSDMPVLSYLAAAHAAQRQKALGRRDDYLRMASRADPHTEVAIGLAQAELQIRSRQDEEALATLKHLEQKAPKHRFVKKLLARLYFKLRDWDALASIIPALEKMQAVSDEELQKFEAAAYGARFEHSDSAEGATRVWQSLSRRSRSHAPLIAHYARALIRHDASTQAEALLRKALNQQWHDSLAEIYGELQLDNPQLAINQASQWLEKDPANPVLLAAIGRLNANAGLWGKARSLLTESINIRPTPQAYQALAQLQEQLGELDAARQNYQAGFELLMQMQAG